MLALRQRFACSASAAATQWCVYRGLRIYSYSNRALNTQNHHTSSTPSVLPTASYAFARRSHFTAFCRKGEANAEFQVISAHPCCTTRGVTASCEAQTQMKACQQPLSMVRARPNECAQSFNPHPPRSRAGDVRPTRRGSRPPGARGPDAPLRPGRASRRPLHETRAPRTARSQVNPTALAAVVRELRKERDALAAAASQAGGEAPRR